MTNRLAQSQSLYLRKHAENPIDWWPWCAEALTLAQQADRPIFLSIGYSSCHWCTVMEGEAFSDPTIADYLNQNFVPIKVDREERPDLDSLYMQTLQMMTGQGGWPLNVFLAPEDRVPFYGGTYFPIEPRYGRPGFLQLLQALLNYYTTNKSELETVKGKILNALQGAALLPGTAESSILGFQSGNDLLQKGLESSAGVLTSGGYGPSFPMIPYAETALRNVRLQLESRYDTLEVCKKRGLDQALGGIYDHVGGGFHRYTVDPTWTVPHFEKMLYDNGQIVEYLANLWSLGIQEPAFERAIAGTVQWLKREMTSPEGYFYAAQDADSFTHPESDEPHEGAFYVWIYSELEKLLTAEELQELSEQFTVTVTGNFEGHNVLQRRQPGTVSESLEIALGKLFTARYGTPAANLPTFPPARNNQEAKTAHWPGRIPAVTDPKMIVAWNSLMISGLARAYAVFHKPEVWELGTTAARFILEHQWVNDRCHRLNYEGQVAVLAQSEDYAFLIKALLDLYQAAEPSDPDSRFWLEQAIRVQSEFDQFLWSEEGGYYNTASDACRDLLLRERSYTDNATPAANGVAIANLVQLSLLTENLDYLDRAERSLLSFATVMAKAPQACPSLFAALDWYRSATLVKTTAELAGSLRSHYLPTLVHHLAPDLPEGVVGLVCQGLACNEPARTPEQLWEQIHQSLVRGNR